MRGISARNIGIILLLLTNYGFAQRQDSYEPAAIKPFPIDITINKTTNLIFPYAIKSVDKGSRDILAQKAKGVDNVLQLKAANENFPETNLTVITADGGLHSFTINYKDHPARLNLKFGVTLQQQNYGAVFPDAENEAEIKSTSEAIAKKAKARVAKRDSRYGIKLELLGIYIRNDILYYHISIGNDTHIPYDIDQLRFFILDQKRSKRTALQETEINPHYVYGSQKAIKGNSESTAVYAFPKHTIPDKKYLSIQMMEKNGGRHLRLKIHNKTIIKSEPVT